MTKELIFYAPLGRGIPASRRGGAESGCKKTLQIYTDAGIKLIIVDKPAKAAGKAGYALGMLKAPFVIIGKLIKHPNAPVHIVGFYRNIVAHEYLLMQICRCFGHKVIYEPRNGSLVSSYKKGCELYKFLVKNLVTKPDVVLCQGQEYVEFIKEKWGSVRTYYPNFIPDNFVKPNKLNRERMPLRLIYFGRVAPSKRIDIIVETAGKLKQHGWNVVLDIIGGYTEDYYQYLQGVINQSNIQDIVTFHGRKDFSFIAEKLRVAHYFIFPSQEEQEGHSNSLTEAMGCGVVPIASKAGFNASICGDKNLVIDGFDAKTYAEKIIEIEENGEWKMFSDYAYNRTLQNYTQRVVGNVLIDAIERLFKSI